MTRQTAAIIAAVSGAFALVGLVFGVLPVSAPSGASCGAAFMPDTGALGCWTALRDHRNAAVAFLIPGVLGLLLANGVRMAAASRSRRLA